MKKEKRSVILFYDLLENLSLLSDKDAGVLIKAIIDYEIHDNVVEFENYKIQRIYHKALESLDIGQEYFDKRYNGVCDEKR